ncbi:hypothetical protein BJ166DRAFT_592045 [Pestalotiopsis sp. NC0098]|nr:hypothetical protein BJ166DRAFT_592045 [Pestalotiopsis sp. NC0098]
MQLGMAIPPEEMARRQQAAGPGLKDAIRQAVGHKATGKRPRGHQQCSQPVDAADLRRRLYMVQSQQERMNERRLLAMIEEATQRAAEEEAEEEREKARQKQQQQQQNSNRTSWVPTIVRGTSNKAPESLGMIRASMRGASSSGDSNNSMSPLSRRTSTQTTQQQRARTGSNRTATSSGSGSGQQQPFHYVPQEAALQFARTATPSQDILRRSNSRKVHELSVEALRLHTEDPALPAAGDHGRALRKVQSEREKLRSRNQFQTAGAIEETKDDDNITQLQQQQQRPAPSKRYTVPSESSKRFSLRWSLQHGDLLHPVRTGGSAAAADEHQLTRHESIQQIAHDHRMVDWTQSDEAEDKDGSGSGKRRSPLLKKADSLWGLKDRLGKRDASTTSSGGVLAERVDAMVPKPVKRGIWTKLRRHAAAVHA